MITPLLRETLPNNTPVFDDDAIAAGLTKIFHYRGIPLRAEHLDQINTLFNTKIKYFFEKNRDCSSGVVAIAPKKDINFIDGRRLLIICQLGIPKLVVIRDPKGNNYKKEVKEIFEATAVWIRTESSRPFSIERISCIKRETDPRDLLAHDFHLQKLLSPHPQILSMQYPILYKNPDSRTRHEKSYSCHPLFNATLEDYHGQFISKCHPDTKGTIVREIMRQVLNGLEYIHHFQIDKQGNTGLVHFGIDPKNIFINWDTEEPLGGTPRVSLGNFRFTTPFQKGQTVEKYSVASALAPEHFAPAEIFRNKKRVVGPKVDLWAAGCLLHLLLYDKHLPVTMLLKAYLLLTGEVVHKPSQSEMCASETQNSAELRESIALYEIITTTLDHAKPAAKTYYPFLIDSIDTLMKFFYKTQYRKDHVQAPFSLKLINAFQTVDDQRKRLVALVKQAIIKEFCNFHLAEETQELDSNLKELLSKLLVIDPDQRMDAKGALEIFNM